MAPDQGNQWEGCVSSAHEDLGERARTALTDIIGIMEINKL